MGSPILPRASNAPVLPTLTRMTGRPARSLAARRRWRGALVITAGALGYAAMVCYLLGLG
jgi:hypothetical protein